MKNTHWHQPLNMNFDSETMPEWFGLPEKESRPSTFSIEYVRSWKRNGNPDTVHPNAAGYRRLAESIKTLLGGSQGK